MDTNDMKTWRVQSPNAMGFHKVITPDQSACQVAQIFRLNLPKGASYTLQSNELELHPVLIQGKAMVQHSVLGKDELDKYESFYIPAQNTVQITALEESIFYIAGAVYEGIGEAFIRKFDSSLPIGDMHQIHGEGAGRREVMFTCYVQ